MFRGNLAMGDTEEIPIEPGQKLNWTWWCSQNIEIKKLRTYRNAKTSDDQPSNVSAKSCHTKEPLNPRWEGHAPWRWQSSWRPPLKKGADWHRDKQPWMGIHGYSLWLMIIIDNKHDHNWVIINYINQHESTISCFERLLLILMAFLASAVYNHNNDQTYISTPTTNIY